MRFISGLLLLIYFSDCYGQFEHSNWVFGKSNLLKFTNSGIIQNQINIKTNEASSSISDSTGNLIFYITPEKIYNSIGQILDSIKGSETSWQGALILKHRKREFYEIFTSGYTSSETFLTLYNHRLDKKLKTDAKNKVIFKSCSEQLTSVNHFNNNDIWLSVHKSLSDTFLFYLLKADGLICCPVIQKKGYDYNKSEFKYFTGTEIKFSPNGKYLANALYTDTPEGYNCELFKFNNEDAELSDIVHIPYYVPMTASFSPDSKSLYVALNVVIQYDISKYNLTDIENSKVAVTPYYNNSIRQIQIAPNGKIYITYLDSSHLGVINSPNKHGSSCNFVEKGLKLKYGKCLQGLPNLNQSYYHTPSIDYAYEQDCRTNSIAFEGKDTIKATNYKWVFNKGTKTDTKSTKDASYTFADTGKWQVKYIASNGSRSDTVTKIITIRPKLEQGFFGNDINYCQTLPTLHAPKNLHCIHWYNDTMAELARVDSLKITKEGTYYAKATNLSFCVEWDTIKVIKAIPKADFETKDVCENDSAVFLNKSTGAMSYSWRFGDGQSSKFENTKHKFQISSTTTFNVTLVAVTDFCSDSITKAVTVNQNPSSDFSYVLTGSNVDLKAVQTSNIKYEWKFGAMDSITQTISNYNRIINLSTQSKVCLRVTNLAGCVSQTCKDVTVVITPILKENDIKIYPNPSKGKLNIEINKVGFYNCKLYSIDGKLIFEKALNGLQTETLNLKLVKGNYFIVLEDEKGNFITQNLILE